MKVCPQSVLLGSRGRQGNSGVDACRTARGRGGGRSQHGEIWRRDGRVARYSAHSHPSKEPEQQVARGAPGRGDAVQRLRGGLRGGRRRP